VAEALDPRKSETAMTEVEAPQESVFQFDSLMQPEFSKCPQPYYRHMRDTNPVIRMGDENISAVFLAKYEDIDHVLHNPRLFSSATHGLEPAGTLPQIPINLDPPEHREWRRLLDPFFNPREMNKLEAEVTRQVNEFIDRFIELGECDYATEYAVPLPCSVFLELMGLPLAELDHFVDLNHKMMHGGSGNLLVSDDVQRGAREEVTRLLTDLIAERRRHPQDDLVTKLINAEVFGRPLTQEEILGTCQLMFVAGLDTVTDTLTCMYAFLGKSPEHRRRLVDEPQILPRAIEEMLRYESPVTMVLPRLVTEDTELGGCPLRKGERLILLLGSANTDERMVDDPDTVDFDRPPSHHYAFGGGVHRCLGSHLARLELRVSLREWHRRIPDYHIPKDAELKYTPRLRQVEHLPIVFDRVIS
jgi:cytochrome P450